MTIDVLTKEDRVLNRDRIEKKILLASSPISSLQIEESLGLNRVVVRTLLRELQKAGRIQEAGHDGYHRLWQWQGHSSGRSKAAPRVNPISSENVNSEVWSHVIARPGSTAHEDLPSRFGNKLVYRDGRQEDI